MKTKKEYEDRVIELEKEIKNCLSIIRAFELIEKQKYGFGDTVQQIENTPVEDAPSEQ